VLRFLGVVFLGETRRPFFDVETVTFLVAKMAILFSPLSA
jgi:hypothetical protein